MIEGPAEDAPVWVWLRNVDPFVRNLGLALAAAGVVLLALDPIAGLPVVLSGPALVRWSKPDAIARWRERRAVQAAIAELEQRHVEGQLTDEAFGTRRDWLVATAAY